MNGKSRDRASSRSIAPTHSCFDDVLEYLETLALEGTDPREIWHYVVVHGICLAPDGAPYAHAWLEFDGDVIQGGIVDGERIFYVLPLPTFLERVRVADQTRYSVDQALLENVRSGHYGPWVERYRALTDDSAEPRVWVDPNQAPITFVIDDEPPRSG